MKRQAHQPILITDAPHSQEHQLSSRQRRYLVMMALRAVCLVVGAVLVSVQAPLLWLWLPLCAVGMVLVPWLAVLIANDRPPKDEHRLFRRASQREKPAPRSLSAEPEEQPRRVIDVEA